MERRSERISFSKKRPLSMNGIMDIQNAKNIKHNFSNSFFDYDQLSKSSVESHEADNTFDKDFKENRKQSEVNKYIYSDESQQLHAKHNYLLSENLTDHTEQNLSQYERLAQQNRLERLKLLDQFGVNEALQSLKEIKTKAPIKKCIQKIKTRSPTERRRSLRLQHTKPNFSYSEDIPVISRSSKVSYAALNDKNRPDGEPIEILKFLSDDIAEKASPFISSFRDIECVPTVNHYNKQEVINNCKQMNELTVAKVVNSRICTMTFHPNNDRVLIFVGSRDGELGIWDVDHEDPNDGLYSFKIHGSCIYGMSFDIHHSNVLYTSGYDGSLRKFDLNTSKAEQIYVVANQNEFISSHCQISSSSFLVAGSKGFVDQIDLNSQKAVKRYFAHNGRKVKVVNSHPTLQHYIATGGLDGNIMLWDLRKMKRNSPIDQYAIGKSVSGLEFSHLGKYLLSTSWDDTVRIIPHDSGSLKNSIRISHNNYTGRFLTPFRSTWLPGRDDLFVVGSLTRPRKIQLYNCDGDIVHNYTNENLQSVCSINVFHPSLQCMAGGNCSGRVNVFRNN